MEPSSSSETNSDYEFIKKVADFSPGLITVYNLKTGEYIYVNGSVRKILGYEPVDFLKGGVGFVSSLIHPDDARKILEQNIEALKRANDNQDDNFTETFEYRIMHKAGFYRWLHTDGRVFSRDAEGKVECMMNISIDVSLNKESEKELRDLSSKLADKALDEARMAEEKIRRGYYHDLLTSLPNRAWFNEQIRLETKKSDKFAIILIDLDRFKLINESLGHPAGDLLLKQTGFRLLKLLESGCELARFGGDEFAIICKNFANESEVKSLAQKILEDFTKSFELNESKIYISPSIGICFYPSDSKDFMELVQCAEVALYYAKDQGKNNFQFYSDDMSIAAGYNLKLESNLRHAIENNQIIVHYQPLVSLLTGEILEVEALCRIEDEQLRLTLPDKFIAVAEVTGLIAPLGEKVLKTACSQIKFWNDNGFAELNMAVNISSHQFKRTDFIKQVEKIIEETSVKPSNLVLELTERVLLESSNEIRKNMKNMARWGIKFSLDDFSMGYSSLNYIQKFPLHELKVDRTFLTGVPRNKSNCAITQSIITLGRNLGMSVVAEGVENVQQLQFLYDRHCEKVQGYIFNPPVPADTISEILGDARYMKIINKIRNPALPLKFNN